MSKGEMTDTARRVADLVEIHELCARYMMLTSQFVQGRWLEVFTPDGEYNAFGTPYTLDRFPALLDAAPRGQFIGNMPVVELDGDRASGVQHFVFIDQHTHAMRLGWYKDEYRRTDDGWRIHRRSTTFMRKRGGFDSGRQHDPLAGRNRADGGGAWADAREDPPQGAGRNRADEGGAWADAREDPPQGAGREGASG